MERREVGSNVSRRRFLRGLGAAGVVAAVPALAACGDDATEPVGQDTGPAGGGGSPAGGGGGEELAVGIMVPLSGTYASLGRDMINGFQLYLDEHGGQLAGRPVRIVEGETEANPEIGLRVARRFIEEERLPVVTGIVSSAVALGVRDLFDERQVPLIVSNAGANDVTRAQRSPVIFRTSFSNWQPAFSVGQWAAENLDVDTWFIIAPDYAAGHEDAAAFREAFADAGKEIVAEAFPPFGTTEDYQPFLSQIRQSEAGGVFAFFSGGEAISFVQQFRDFGLKDQLTLIGPGFLTDEGVLPAQGDAALGIRTSLHWTPLLDIPKNQEFTQAYEEAFGMQATVFSVQSYDAAQLIDLGLADYDGDLNEGAAVAEALAGVGELDSPRGPFRLDPDTHNPIQPFYLREVQEVEGAEGGLANAVIEELGEVRDPGA